MREAFLGRHTQSQIISLLFRVRLSDVLYRLPVLNRLKPYLKLDITLQNDKITKFPLLVWKLTVTIIILATMSAR